MSKRLKKLIKGELETRFGGISNAVLIDYQGLSAEETRLLRDTLRAEGMSVNVVKNTIVRMVFRESGVELPASCFSGPTAIVHGEKDAVSASKTLDSWYRQNGKRVTIKAGVLDGEALSETEAKTLPTLPSPEELHAMIVSLVSGPLTSLVGIVNNVLSGVPGVIQAIVEKKKEEGESNG